MSWYWVGLLNAFPPIGKRGGNRGLKRRAYHFYVDRKKEEAWDGVFAKKEGSAIRVREIIFDDVIKGR